MNKNDTCYFCGYQFSEKNYKLKLMEANICSFCERRLLNSTVSDSVYEFFKDKIKKLWVS